jgi:transcription elongation factor GreB
MAEPPDDRDEIERENALADAEEARPKGPSYMTPSGHARLVAELEALGVERARVVSAVTDAAAEGDRSENAEYIYGKRRLRQIDSRMRFLRKVVESVVLVDPSIDRGDRVYFGATVVLEGATGERVVHQLVGEHETDAETGKISYRSPLGAALLRKEAGDDVTVETPGGRRTLRVAEVRYGGS